MSIGLGFSFAAAMYTHYFAFLFVGFMGVMGLILVKRHTILPYLISGILAVLLFLPHLEVTLYHTSLEGGLLWLPPPTSGWLFDFLFFAFNSSWFIIPVITLLVIAGIYNSIILSKPTYLDVFNLFFWHIHFSAYHVAIQHTNIKISSHAFSVAIPHHSTGKFYC